MFKFDPNSSYMMPAHFGPRHMGEKTSGWYHDVTMMIVPYLTDRDKLAAYLPVLDYLPAFVTKGSSNLFIPDRLPRALR